MAGRQCPKRLWLDVFAPEEAKISAATEQAFAVGHDVGAVAQRLWPDGVLIGHDQDLHQGLEETATYLSATGAVTLFEGTVQAGWVLIRADVLERHAQGDFHLVEVKASTSVKPHFARELTWGRARPTGPGALIGGYGVDTLRLISISYRENCLSYW